MATKKAKSDADIKYQYSPHGQQHCSLCVMFRPPDNCTHVAGFIARNGWCKIFAKRVTNGKRNADE